MILGFRWCDWWCVWLCGSLRPRREWALWIWSWTCIDDSFILLWQVYWSQLVIWCWILGYMKNVRIYEGCWVLWEWLIGIRYLILKCLRAWHWLLWSFFVRPTRNKTVFFLSPKLTFLRFSQSFLISSSSSILHGAATARSWLLSSSSWLRRSRLLTLKVQALLVSKIGWYRPGVEQINSD